MKAIDAAYFQEIINQYRIKQEERANKGLGLEYFGPNEMQMLLDKMPTFETEPVRHGWWEYVNTSQGLMCSCSECGEIPACFEPDYCPNCGAKMDLKE